MEKNGTTRAASFQVLAAPDGPTTAVKATKWRPQRGDRMQINFPFLAWAGEVRDPLPMDTGPEQEAFHHHGVNLGACLLLEATLGVCLLPEATLAACLLGATQEWHPLEASTEVCLPHEASSVEFRHRGQTLAESHSPEATLDLHGWDQAATSIGGSRLVEVQVAVVAVVAAEAIVDEGLHTPAVIGLALHAKAHAITTLVLYHYANCHSRASQATIFSIAMRRSLASAKKGRMKGSWQVFMV